MENREKGINEAAKAFMLVLFGWIAGLFVLLLKLHGII